MSSTWADIVGYEGLYLVSDDGRVKSAATGNDLRQSVRNGYKCVNLWRDNKYKTKKVHRLVAQAFVPNPSQKTQINHIDGNKANNHANNLEWCTAGENNKHAYIELSSCNERMQKAFEALFADAYGNATEA